MYRENTLARNVLITVDEVLFHAPTKHEIDPRNIEPSIIIAEERFVRPLLGYELYEAMIAQKNKLVTTANLDTINEETKGSFEAGQIVNSMEYFSTAAYKTLWKEVLWKFTAECVALVATPENFVQFGATGIVHTNPLSTPMMNSNLVSPELRSVKWLMDKKLMDRVDPLRDAVQLHICKNKASFPLYDKLNDCDCYADRDGGVLARKSDIIFGLYDDPDDSCECP